MKNSLLYKTLVIVAFIGSYFMNAQNSNNFHLLESQAKYIFNTDSLQGFEQAAAERAALSEGYYGDEFKIRMYQYKRGYINSKYHLKKPNTSSFFEASLYTRAASCNNEDFESSSSATITSSTQIAGWIINSGNNSAPNNACNLGGCCPSQPIDCELIQCPAGGYIDAKIGNCYPIFSVFGNPNNNGNTFNPLLPQMKGDKIIRINNDIGGADISRLSKSINVTSTNALFQFAYLNVFFPTHACCFSSAVFIKITNVTAGTVIPCPTLSSFAPSGFICTNTTNVQFFIAGSNCPTNSTSNNVSPVFNKWILNSLDLSPYFGSNILIEVTATDCATGGHYAYTYFDAQCAPLDIVGNNVIYPISTPSIILTSCAPHSNTIIAPPNVGPYTWTSTAIAIPPNLATPSNTNTTFISNQSGTVALIMSPPGICAPIVKVITLSVSTGPTANVQVTQPSCTNSIATVSLTISSNSSLSPSINWNPQGTISSNSLTNTNPPVGVGSVTIQDSPGCFATLNYTINSSPFNPVINSTTVISTKCGFNIGSIELAFMPTTTTFTWSPPVSNTYSASNLAEGVYTINFANQTCVTKTVITIDAADKATILNVLVNESRCDASTGGATITALNSNGIYNWTPVVSTSSIISNAAAGNYTVNVGSGACGTTHIVYIPPAENPNKMDFIKQDNLCKKKNGVISIINVYGGTPPYAYSFNNGSYSNLKLYDSLLGGNYIVTIKDAKGCIYNQLVTINDLNQKTNLYYKINISGSCDEQYEVAIDSIRGGKSPYYLSVNNSPYFFSQTISGLLDINYSIKVIDDDGCVTDNLINNTNLKSKPIVYIPNSFTPNDDGLNDTWYPYINCSFEYDCLIFDRWGILIKELKNTEDKWDGILKGKPLPIGVYCYIIDIIGFDRKSTRLTGHINLIK